MWKIERYNESHKEEWNGFVRSSRQGTFLFDRNYMDYHSDRFCDCSLMFRHNGSLRVLLPAHMDGSRFLSHKGLTYGGFITDCKLSALDMMEIFVQTAKYIHDELMLHKWVYLPVPYIYSSIAAQEDLYALWRMEAVHKECKISSVVYSPGSDIQFSTLRMRKVKKALKCGFEVCSSTDATDFWSVLSDNLITRHSASPVHSLQEIHLLMSRFPDNIKLWQVVDNAGEVMAGCIIYDCGNVVHVQYIASSPCGRDNGAVDLLFDRLVHNEYAGRQYFDFGTSVENGGHVLNNGLIFQKEGFGARGVVYSTYEMDIDSIINRLDLL